MSNWERHFTLISHSGHAVYPSWWPSPTKDLQTEPQKGVSCVGVAEPGSYDRNEKYAALVYVFLNITPNFNVSNCVSLRYPSAVA